MPATVKVNEPVIHRGVAIYQSSFEDGGSQVQLRALPLTRGGQPFELSLRVGENTPLVSNDGQQKLQLEVTGLKVINVRTSRASASPPTCGRSIWPALDSTWRRRQPRQGQDAAQHRPGGHLPAGDAAGQAREYHNYMLPIELDASPSSSPA
jgi:cytochrome c biogenesis protein